MTTYVKEILIFIGVLAILLTVVDGCSPYDDTDPLDKSARSGMKVYRDALTGCEYLSAGVFFTALTPRMSEGKQVCRNPKP